jgi:hypothetical protein
MKLYSDYAARRTGQIIFDVMAILAISAWVWLGVTLYTLVMNLSAFGVQMENAGSGFKKTMSDISVNLSGVPLIGGGIKAPFDAASDAGHALEQAGQAQQVAVHNLALGLGIGIAIVPILTILIFWLIPRVRFARRASVAKSLLKSDTSVDLLALRALSTRKLAAIAAIDPDPAGAWRRGDTAVIRSLANLELRASGVKLAGVTVA